MDKEVLEKLEKLERSLEETKQELLTEFAVYTHKESIRTSEINASLRTLKFSIEKFFDYKNYFDNKDTAQ